MTGEWPQPYRKDAKAGLRVAQTAANAWGLHDMHGNVMEWTLDQYHADYYAKQPAGEKFAPVTELYPTAVRGGSWDDEPADLRSA